MDRLGTGNHADPRFLRYAADPVGFVRDCLGEDPWARQEEILRALAEHPQVTVRSGHGVGKTFTAACAALWFLHCHAPSLVLTTAPTKRQVESLLWGEINVLWKKAKTRLPGRCLKTKAEAGPEQRAEGFTADSQEGAAGYHAPHVLIIIDEASGIPPTLLETLQGALTSAHCVILMIGNPTRPSGPFFDSHRLNTWHKFRLSCLDSPNFAAQDGEPPPFPALVTREWVEKRRQEWGETSTAFRVRVLGEFPEAGDTTLFTLADLEAALDVDSSSPTPRVLGVDVARFGECETAVAVRIGNELVDLVAWQGADLVASAGRVLALIDEHHPEQVIVDTVGLGAGLFDHLKAALAGDPAALPEHRRRIQVLPFVSQTRALDALHFHSRRDEAYWRLSQLIKDKTVRFSREFSTLTGQLTSLNYRYTTGGQVAIESKDDLRRRGIASPDHADALALAFSQAAPAFHRPQARGHVRGT